MIYAFQGLCGGHFTTETGVLNSPSFTNEYTRDCVYTISAPKNTIANLTVTMLDTIGCADYLEIRDRDSKP